MEPNFGNPYLIEKQVVDRDNEHTRFWILKEDVRLGSKLKTRMRHFSEWGSNVDGKFFRGKDAVVTMLTLEYMRKTFRWHPKKSKPWVFKRKKLQIWKRFIKASE